jgi:hypothetical protein
MSPNRFSRLFCAPLLRPFAKNVPCIFVLSTGRVGTDTLARLLATEKTILACHEPYPRFLMESRDAYQNSPLTEDAAGELVASFVVGRARKLMHCYLSHRQFAETSNRLTYFAPLLAEAFPKSKFIHLFRHPSEVIRSGMRRRYYDGAGWDYCRITPRTDDIWHERWSNWSPFEKCCWYWQAVNKFALDFIKELPSERTFSMDSGDLFRNCPSVMRALFKWLRAVPPTEETRQSVLKMAHNQQHSGEFPTLSDWTEDQRNSLREISGPIARQLGYSDF